MSQVELSGISLRRGGRIVLSDVSVRFGQGRLTAVIGPNGAGKSSLLGVAAGLLAPAAGQVRIDGRTPQEIGRRTLARIRAYLPQSPRVDWPISVERVVALGLMPHLPAFGALPDAWAERIDRALAEHDLLALRDRQATRLSGGELSRVMLACATIGDPALLIVDEPTAGLDPRHALDAAARLRALADSGRTVIVALHDIDLAARIADDIVALKEGRVMSEGAVGKVLTAELLGRLYDVRAVIGGEDEWKVRFIGR